MKELSFYDLKAKKKFKADTYKIAQRGKAKFAVAKAPSGVEAWRILPKDFTQ